jgi:hypothetical protein
MRFDPNKTFPYPVLRPHPAPDDYTHSGIQVTVVPSISSSHVVMFYQFDLSSKDLNEYINHGVAEYVGILSCRDTFFRYKVASKEVRGDFQVPVEKLRGEVRFDSYVVARSHIKNFRPRDLHPEYGDQAFEVMPGFVLAQNEPQLFHVDRAAFAPITSVVDLVVNDELKAGEWRVSLEDEHIRIQVDRSAKEAIDDARNDSAKKVILLNSLYLPAIMTVLLRLKQDQEIYANHKWCNVLKAKLDNEGVDLESGDVAEIAQKLLRHPLSILVKKVLKNGGK